MKALIIDDELLARERILSLLEDYSNISVAKECSTGKEAISAINDLRPDLIFLDIDMKDLTGFQVLENITVTPKPLIIFITAHDEYALKAFDFEAFDFLVKPFKQERFHRTIDKVQNSKKDPEQDFQDKLQQLLKLYEASVGKKNTENKIPVKQGNKTYLIDILDVKYIIASGYYAEIFTDQKKYLIRESLNNLLPMMGEDKFLRIHRSTIINVDYIQEILHSNFSEIDVKMKDNKILRISKSYKKHFLERLGIN